MHSMLYIIIYMMGVISAIIVYKFMNAYVQLHTSKSMNIDLDDEQVKQLESLLKKFELENRNKR